MSKGIKSKTIIGVGLIMSCVWLFSGKMSKEITKKKYIKSKNYISNIIKNVTNGTNEQINKYTNVKNS
jgi:hypothetical protein